MNADELRSLQAPLKAQYRERPETALSRRRPRDVGENMTCKIETGKSRAEAGLHPRPAAMDNVFADMLLEALVGCRCDALAQSPRLLALHCTTPRFEQRAIWISRHAWRFKDVPVGFK
jgi:hypothetical protein